MRIRNLFAVVAAMLMAAPVFAAHHESGHSKQDAMASKSIVEIAAGNENFSTLVTALKEAGLVDTLAGDGPFTVFAPTDAAFAELPDGTLQSLLKAENRDKLRAILTYHVVPGKVTSGDLKGKRLDAATVQGSKVAIDATDGVEVDDANVVQADIMASNGVIHVIDKVIMPKS